MTIRERFESKFRIDEYGCHVWSAGTDSGGYGVLHVDTRDRKAHRVAWELYIGPIPTGKWVLHDCQSHGAPKDNRACVNPSHLWLGTRRANVADMYKKSGSLLRCGENNGRSRLTSVEVTAIRYAHVMFGCSRLDLTKAMGVSRSTIDKVINGRCWKHV